MSGSVCKAKKDERKYVWMSVDERERMKRKVYTKKTEKSLNVKEGKVPARDAAS